MSAALAAALWIALPSADARNLAHTHAKAMRLTARATTKGKTQKKSSKKGRKGRTAAPSAVAATDSTAAKAPATFVPAQSPEAPSPATGRRRSVRAAPRASTTVPRAAATRRARRVFRRNPGPGRAPIVPAPLPAVAAAKTKRAAPEPAKSHRGSTHRGPITRTVHDIVEVIPESIQVALAALAALSILLGGGYLFAAVRARRLGRQRAELLDEVGLLQAALLPAVPRHLGSLRVSVAYRPADGPGAGGDFYDVLRLPEGRTGFIVGDISGHGRAALARTAFLRYTLRAYLAAGLEPRAALQVGDRVDGDRLEGDFATVLLAVHDPDTGALTYASAGHPPPIVAGPSSWIPVTRAASPPLGIGFPTGLRQTTLPLPLGTVACMFTDGLPEARTRGGGILGRGRLGDILSELGRDVTAPQLLERVAAEAWAVRDDMAACVMAPTSATTAGTFQTEQLELSPTELESGLAFRFLTACGVDERQVAEAVSRARATAERSGGALLQVTVGNRLRVDVLPPNVASIETAHASAARRRQEVR